MEDKVANHWLFIPKSKYNNKQPMVINPKETWGEFAKSMINFEEPKIVPVNSVGNNFDPSKRKF